VKRSFNALCVISNFSGREGHGFSIGAIILLVVHLKVRKQKLGVLLSRTIQNSFGPLHSAFEHQTVPAWAMLWDAYLFSWHTPKKSRLRWNVHCSGWRDRGKIKIWRFEALTTMRRNSCFPILINWGNESGNTAKDRTHWKETPLKNWTDYKSYSSLKQNSIIYDWQVQLNLEHFKSITKFPFREGKENHASVFRHLQKNKGII
jgi:hypothetical protein